MLHARLAVRRTMALAWSLPLNMFCACFNKRVTAFPVRMGAKKASLSALEKGCERMNAWHGSPVHAAGCVRHPVSNEHKALAMPAPYALKTGLLNHRTHLAV